MQEHHRQPQRPAARTKLLPAALMVLGLAATAAQAVPVFDNGAPDQGYGVNMNANVVAEDFTLGGATDITFLHFWSIQTTLGQYGGSIGWSILSDAGGTPGAVQFSGSASPSAVATGASGGFLDAGYTEYTFDIPMAVQLGGGTHWLALASTPLNPVSPAEMLWETTATGSGGTARYFDADLSAWTDTGFNLAFNIEGAAVVTPPPIPEPSTLALMAAGLLAVGIRRRLNR